MEKARTPGLMEDSTLVSTKMVKEMDKVCLQRTMGKYKVVFGRIIYLCLNDKMQIGEKGLSNMSAFKMRESSNLLSFDLSGAHTHLISTFPLLSALPTP